MPTEPDKATCPQCQAKASYQTICPSGTPFGAFNLLPRLGGLIQYAEMQVVVCAECGLIRLFASREARKKLVESGQWSRVLSPGGGHGHETA